jgi:hypothetical protein
MHTVSDETEKRESTTQDGCFGSGDGKQEKQARRIWRGPVKG